MSESKFLFERAKKLAINAIQAERDGNFTVAFDQFLKAAELLNQLISMEKSEKIKDSYYAKAREYIVRAKEIKLLMTDAPLKKEARDEDLSETSKPLPSPPKTTPPPITPEKAKDDDEKLFNFQPKQITPPSPPPPEDLTSKLMRGEDEDQPPLPLPSPESTQPPQKLPPPPKKDVELPKKTTFELLYDQGKYIECIRECTKSVEAELRVRMGLFDEQLTLGMLIDRATKKGMDVLKDFKYVNILFNRIEHENYRPKSDETLKAVEITIKILLS